MRAVSRYGKALLASALALAPCAALGQQASPVSKSPVSDTPAVDTIGPAALQNFSLNGTVTRASEQPAAVPGRTRAQRSEAKPASAAPQQTAQTVEPVAPAPKPRRAAVSSTEPPKPAEAAPTVRRSPSPVPNANAAPLASAPAATFASDPVPAVPVAPAHKFPLLPWLLAALALGAGGAYLFFRNRGREAFADGPRIEALLAPSPAPAPAPAPQPRAPAPKPAGPASTGVVSTRLRPWIEIGFNPVRCVLDGEKLTVDFEIELFNSGSAPARGVLVEASLFNAGPEQDRQIKAFFAQPDSGDDRIDIVPPMQRIALRTQVFAPIEQLQAYELGGRPAVLPLIAFNALYKWSGGDGQTSSSYLLGRDTKGDKMAPFHLDRGARIFRGVGARILPEGIRR